MGVRAPAATAAILSALVVSSGATAETDAHPICPLVLHEERVAREERELAVDLAVSRLAATQSIFEMVDRLWQDGAIERLLYLTAKHDRDVAKIEVKRQQLLLKRQEAELEQYACACSAPGPAETAADRRARLGDAHRRYVQADCHRTGKDLAIAEVDLAYHREVLVSVRDSREHDVATRQDVIRAERDAELARKRVEHLEPRVRACASSGAASGSDAR